MSLITHDDYYILIFFKQHLHSNGEVLSLLNLFPVALEQHTSCMDEILNLSAKLCLLIHDLSSFHARVIVQTALGSESTRLTLSMFSGVLTVLLEPGGFFTILPVVLRL